MSTHCVCDSVLGRRDVLCDVYAPLCVMHVRYDKYTWCGISLRLSVSTYYMWHIRCGAGIIHE